MANQSARFYWQIAFDPHGQRHVAKFRQMYKYFFGYFDLCDNSINEFKTYKH